MTVNKGYAVILVPGTSHAIRAETILRQATIPAKLIPVPRQLSSNCGVCVRISKNDKEAARQALENERLEIVGIHPI